MGPVSAGFAVELQEGREVGCGRRVLKLWRMLLGTMKRFLGRAPLILVLLYARPRLTVLVRMYYVWAPTTSGWSMARPNP